MAMTTDVPRMAGSGKCVTCGLSIRFGNWLRRPRAHGHLAGPGEGSGDRDHG